MGCKSDECFRDIFFKYGLIIPRFKFILILLPLLSTGLLAIGFLLLQERFIISHRDLFWPANGRWKNEKDIFDGLFPVSDNHFFPARSFNTSIFTDVIVSVKKGVEERNLMKLLLEVRKLALELENFEFYPEFDNPEERRYSYQHLCVRSGPTTGCYTNNRHINFFLDQSHIWESLGENTLERIIVKDTVESNIHIHYPFSRIGGEPFYIGNLLGGVKVLSDNGSDPDQGIPYYAQTIRLLFTLIQDGPESKKSLAWQTIFEEKLLNWNKENPDSNLTPAFYSSDTTTNGMNLLGKLLPDYFVLAVVILTTFASMCSLVFKTEPNGCPRLDLVRSKPILALAGVVTAGLGATSAIGFLLICGVRFNHICGIMPYLVSAIGVDDMFIMTSSFHRTSRKKTVAQRMAATMSHAAVSVTITSLTDVLSFAVGCTSGLALVVQFCAYCSAGITFNYIYQVTFFAAVLAVTAEWEEKNRNVFFPLHIAAGEQNSCEIKNSGKIDTIRKSKVAAVSHPHEKSPNHSFNSAATRTDGIIPKFFRDWYGPFLTHDVSRVGVMIIYCAYLGSSIFGITQLEQGIDLAAVGPRGFHLGAYYEAVEDFWMKGGGNIHVLMQQVPDLSKKGERIKINATIDAFLNTEFSLSRSFVEFWLDRFELRLNYLENKNMSYDFNKELCRWTRTNDGKEYWKMDIIFENGNCEPQYQNYSKVLATRFIFAQKNIHSTHNQSKAQHMARKTAEQFPEYNLVTYGSDYPFGDWFIQILPSTLQNMGIAIACMIVVSLILIPSVTCAVLITLSIISIDLGVFGFMSLWSIKLDCISSICLLMSVGFSVDLSAHISYAFITSKGGSRERAIEALGSLGAPILQGGISTVLGVLALLCVDAIMVEVMVQMIFLVIAFGLIHSLVFLPVVLMLTVPRLPGGTPVQSAPVPDSSRDHKQRGLVFLGRDTEVKNSDPGSQHGLKYIGKDILQPSQSS